MKARPEMSEAIHREFWMDNKGFQWLSNAVLFDPMTITEYRNALAQWITTASDEALTELAYRNT